MCIQVCRKQRPFNKAQVGTRAIFLRLSNDQFRVREFFDDRPDGLPEFKGSPQTASAIRYLVTSASFGVRPDQNRYLLSFVGDGLFQLFKGRVLIRWNSIRYWRWVNVAGHQFNGRLATGERLSQSASG